MEAWEVIQAHKNMPSVFSNAYFSEFHGKVQYNEYNPKRLDYEGFKDTIEGEQKECVESARKLFGEMVEVI